MPAEPADEKHEDKLKDHEIETIEDHAPIRAVAIFEAIRREGKLELERPVSALTMSGLVAGMALGLSVLVEASFRRHLPDADWRPLVESLGYTVGFLVVILSQMQLFTENTIKAVCPVLDEISGMMIARLLRLWFLVLGANIAGAAAFGLVLYWTRDYQPAVWHAMRELSLEALGYGWTETLLRGVGAGWLIAALVWMMPNAGDAKAYVIILMTYLVALADFAHVVAGTTEATLLVMAGDRTIAAAAGGFVLPAVIGNVLGGTVFFTVLTWVQIRTELEGRDEPPIDALRKG
ncbi:MAG: formate/nitrite transporter family protein [Paracoccaceae bacterium]